MRKTYLLLVFIAFFTSCKTIQKTIETTEQREQEQRSTDTKIIIDRVTDTLVMRILPKESSKSFGKDTVRVETQFAFARGWISWVSDSTYLIVVQIENKATAMLAKRIIYKNVFKEKTDTLYLSQKTESNKTELVIKNDNAFMRYIIACGWILQGVMLILLLWGIWKIGLASIFFRCLA